MSPESPVRNNSHPIAPISPPHIVAEQSKMGTLANTLQDTVETTSSLCSKIQKTSTLFFQNVEHKIESISLAPIIVVINKVGTTVERTFNVVSCLPILGLIAGDIRVLVGKLQIIAGLAIAIIAEIGMLIENYNNKETVMLSKWKALSLLGQEQMIHGGLNVIHGTAISMLATYTLGLGNFLLLLPNAFNKREFLPYFAYGTIAGGKIEKQMTAKEKALTPPRLRHPSPNKTPPKM